MDAEGADKYLSKGPCIVTSTSPFAPLLLDNYEVVDNPIEFDNSLDDLQKTLTRRRIVVREDYGRVSRRFPRISIDEEICDKVVLNRLVSEKYEQALSLFPRQSQLWKRVIQVPKDEAVVFIVVDGLSYHCFKDYLECEPAIVDGVTRTPEGISRVIGTPTIAQRMFERGRKNQYGYSFWSREEEKDITGRYFSPIPEENFTVYSDYEEVLSDLENRHLKRSYVQIFQSGLDGICHKYRDTPPIEAVLTSIKDKVLRVEDVLAKKKVKGMLFLTSDHGILWKKENDFRVISDPSLVDGGPRWTNGKVLRPNTICFPEGITSLKYPYVTCNLRRTEWGVHGGVSYDESIIPWVSRMVG